MGCSCIRIQWRIQIQNIRDYFSSQRKILWIIYRSVVTIYCLAALTLWLIRANTRYNAIVYLTTWTYIMLCVYNILAVIGPLIFTSSSEANTSDPKIEKNNCPDGTSDDLQVTTDANLLEKTNMDASEEADRKVSKYRLLSCFGMIFEQKTKTRTKSITLSQCTFLVLWNTSASIASVLGITVTIIYYSAICQKVPTCDKYENINVHGLSSLFIFIDLLSCRPVGFLQIVFPLVYGSVYGIFTVAFWAKDHSHVIYTILNWNKPGKSLGWTLGFLVVGTVVHILIYYFHVLLTKCLKKFRSKKGDTKVRIVK